MGCKPILSIGQFPTILRRLSANVMHSSAAEHDEGLHGLYVSQCCQSVQKTSDIHGTVTTAPTIWFYSEFGPGGCEQLHWEDTIQVDRAACSPCCRFANLELLDTFLLLQLVQVTKFSRAAELHDVACPQLRTDRRNPTDGSRRTRWPCQITHAF